MNSFRFLENIVFGFLLLSLSGCAHATRSRHVDATAHKSAKLDQVALDEPDAKLVQTPLGATSTIEISNEIFKQMPLIEDRLALTYANSVAQYIAVDLIPALRCKTDGTLPTSVRIAIVRSQTPAAFSISGGRLFVTTALMKRIANEDEFAGLLANEMSFSICRSSRSTDANELISKPLSQATLSSADRTALIALYKRGYDVQPYANFVARAERKGRRSFGLERAELMKKMIAATPKFKSTAGLRTARFQAAKAKSI